LHPRPEKHRRWHLRAYAIILASASGRRAAGSPSVYPVMKLTRGASREPKPEIRLRRTRIGVTGRVSLDRLLTASDPRLPPLPGDSTPQAPPALRQKGPTETSFPSTAIFDAPADPGDRQTEIVAISNTSKTIYATGSRVLQIIWVGGSCARIVPSHGCRVG
jgi:hypothetical protein